MHENILKWFERVQRKTADAHVRREENITVDGKKFCGRPKKRGGSELSMT